MRILISLFILILFGTLNSQRYDLIEWYRIYGAKGYMNADSTDYIEVDLRLYPPEHLFYNDTTVSKYPWKLDVWFYRSREAPLGGTMWTKKNTVTYGRWVYMRGGCMFLGADSLRENGSISWRRQKGDKGKNSYFLFDYGLYYALKIFNAELAQFADIVVFPKEASTDNME